MSYYYDELFRVVYLEDERTGEREYLETLICDRSANIRRYYITKMNQIPYIPVSKCISKGLNVVCELFVGDLEIAGLNDYRFDVKEDLLFFVLPYNELANKDNRDYCLEYNKLIHSNV